MGAGIGVFGRLVRPLRARASRVRSSVGSSGRLRAFRLLFETSKTWTAAVAFLILANALLPNLVFISVGVVVGRIPAATRNGLGSPAGHQLTMALIIAGIFYAGSLLIGPYEDVLTSVVRLHLSDGMQDRLMKAVSGPTGVAHLEDPELLDRLASAQGSMLNVRPSDAPVTLAGVIGVRLGGIIACAVVGWFHWWLGLGLFVMWISIRRPLHTGIVDQVKHYIGSTSVFRRSFYFLLAGIRPAPAKEVRVFGLKEWIVGRYRHHWFEGMEGPFADRKHFERRVVGLTSVVLIVYLVACGSVAWSGFHHEIGIGEVSVVLTMLVASMSAGSISYEDLSLAEMVNSLPDVDELEDLLHDRGEDLAGERPAAGMPAREIRFAQVTFGYPRTASDVLKELDLTIPAGRSTAIVGLNGAGKTTLIKLLARLHDPTGGFIAIDGTPLVELEPKSWQQQVSVVNQEFNQYPLSARDNVGFGSIDHLDDNKGIETAAARSGALSIIEGLPNGWDTVLSRQYTEGVDLSGGQWQRIALARALFAVQHGAKILVLDEPTSWLDVRAEAEILRSVSGYHKGCNLDHHLPPVLHRSSRRPHLRAERGSNHRRRRPRRVDRQGWAIRRDVPPAGRPFRRVGDGPMRARLTSFTRTWRILFLSGFAVNRGLMTFSVLASVLVAIAGVSYALGYRVMIDAIVAGHASGAVVGAILIALLFTVSWGLATLNGTMGSTVRDHYNVYLSSRISTLISGIPGIEHFERTDYLEELDLLQQNRVSIANGPRQTMAVLQVAVRSITIIVLLGTVYPPLALVPLLAVFAFIGDDRSARLRDRIDKSVAEQRRLAGDLFTLASTAGPARELRTFGLRKEIHDRHQALNGEVRARAIRGAVIGSIWSAGGWLVYGAGFAAAVVLVTVRATRGEASIGDVVMTVGLLLRAQQQLSLASSSVGQLVTTGRATRHLMWLEDRAAEEALQARGQGAVPHRITRGISLVDIDFTYPGTSTPVLKDLSLFLPAGTAVAIVGENGAGKSTLVKLLTGMYQPTRGSIQVDDFALANLDVDEWRSRTTAAFQDFVRFQLFAGQSVGVGDLPLIDDEAAVENALIRAEAGGVLESLPSGFLTPLGWSMPGGQDLSGGQWQKLALGRAMMRDDPLLLVLDEPTASLDAPTESGLFNRYIGAARRGATRSGAVTIFISHRFSTVRMADLIVVLQQGRIVESGDHDSLMRGGALYAELFELQARSYR